MGDGHMRYDIRELASAGRGFRPPADHCVRKRTQPGVGFRSQVKHAGEAPWLRQLQVESLVSSQERVQFGEDGCVHPVVRQEWITGP